MLTWTTIEGTDQLQRLVDHCLTLPAVALDTEFVRTRTYYPRLGLVQLATPDGLYLIDPLAFDDLSPLASLLHSDEVVKVMHACNEDLELFYALFNRMPSRVWDTQLAAMHLAQGSSIGLAKLLKQQFAIDLAKDETQSDWCARPLTAAQQRYAALDVAHLLALHQQQCQQLPVARHAWIFEDVDFQTLSALPTKPSQSYLRLRAAWPMTGAKLWFLQALLAWREQLAKEKDIPRGFVLKDPIALAIAESWPKNKAALAKCGPMPNWVLRHHADWILDLIAEAATTTAEQWPASIAAPLAANRSEPFRVAKAFILSQATALKIPEDCLFKRKVLEQVLCDNDPVATLARHPYFSGWRAELLVPGLSKLLS